jgi:phosphate transport system substrate-binding protein
MRRGLTSFLAIGILTGAAYAQTNGTVRGAGASFPAPIYQKWIESFQAGDPGPAISYESVGSEEGIRRLEHGDVDFAASDIVPSQEMQDRLGVELLPSVVGAVVPAYNLHGLARDLRFTPDLLAAIFLGRITKWNDPRIKEVNRGANLPDADIIVVHRSDGSGTTHVLSEYLSKTNAEWRDAMGTGSTLEWKVGEGAKGNDGVANALARTPYAIGYLEFIYALENQLSYAAVKNASGKFVRPDIDSITAAARSAPEAEPFRASITDPPGRDAYPIASFTWLIIPARAPPSAKRDQLLGFLEWAFSSGQRQAGALGYVALPEELAARERSVVARLKRLP